MRVWARAATRPSTYRAAAWLQTRLFRARAKFAGTLTAGSPYTARGWLTTLPGPIKGWTTQRDLPTPPARNFRHWWHTNHQTPGRE